MDKRDIVALPKWLRLTLMAIFVTALLYATGSAALSYFLRMQTLGIIARINSDLRITGKALQDYAVENEQYPPSLIALTTPLPYLISLVNDPMHRNHGESFGYLPATDRFVILSVGLDGLQNVTSTDLKDGSAALMNKSYNVTNGTFSSGDIILTGSLSASQQPDLGVTR